MHEISSPYPLGIHEKWEVRNALKRIFDLGVSSVALVFCLPFLVLLFFLVKRISKGPAFYSSQRIGKKGKLFTCWKLRSMYCDADQRLEAELASNTKLKEEWQTYFKLKQDPRLTPIGRFLRSTSLDELPQLWNVFIGDLSLVGPRPYLPREMDTVCKILGKDVEKLFSVKPGLTGPWQTSGRNFLTFEQRVRMEVLYSSQASFFFDLYQIVKTLPILLFRKGAF